MKRNVLLFDGDCAACSRVARLIHELAIADLEVLGLRDEKVAQALDHAGLSAPDRPSLLVTDGDRLRILSGWSMRRRLASMIGWRRSRTIVRLLASEWHARTTRAAEATGTSRRGFVGTATAGVVGLAMLPRSIMGRTASANVAYVPADAADVERALASVPVQRAVQTWGPVRSAVMEVKDGAERVLVFTHHTGEDQVITFVDNSADARHGTPVSLSMAESPSANHGIRYYTVDGTPMADIVMGAHGKTEALPVSEHHDAGKYGFMMPDGFHLRCWLLCLQEFNVNLSPGCFQNCEECFELISARACVLCAACAGGAKAIACAKRCTF